MVDVFQATADELEDLAPLFNEYRMFYKRASDVDGARSSVRYESGGRRTRVDGI